MWWEIRCKVKPAGIDRAADFDFAGKQRGPMCFIQL